MSSWFARPIEKVVALASAISSLTTIRKRTSVSPGPPNFSGIPSP